MLRERSPMEVFVDEFLLVVLVVFVAGGVIGAIAIGDIVPRDIGIDPDALSYWVVNRGVAFAIGLLAAFLFVDVPLTLTLMWVRKNRPRLFVPRRD